MSSTQLEAVADELLLSKYSNAEVTAFMGDILNTSKPEALGNHVSSINAPLIEAWKAMTVAANVGTAFARDYPLLVKIKDIRADASKLAAFNYGTIGSFEQFLNTYNTVDCNTCPASGAGSDPDIFGKLTDILDNTLGEYQKHKSTPNFTGFYSGEPFARDSRNKRDGGQFMLRVMATDGRTNGAVSIDQKFKDTFPFVTGNYEYDLYFGNANPATLWFIECKSTEELPADMGQLTAYFSAIQNISNLEYIFNTKKIGTETQAKDAIRTQLYNGAALTNMGNNLFNTIWGNTALRGNLFPEITDFDSEDAEEIAKGLFSTKVSNISNTFYSFIKIK